MKNPVVIILAVIVLVAIGFGIYSISQNPNTSPVANSAAGTQEAGSGISPDDTSFDEDVPVTATGGQYVEYTPEVFETASDTKRVLYYYANWCPTCRPADADFQTNESRIPDDVTVIRVNYNDDETDQQEKDLANQYNVTYQHTFVQIDNQGHQIGVWNGGAIDELLVNLQ